LNSPSTEPEQKNRRLFLYLLLVLFILTIYHRLPDYDFVNYDDPVYVTDNQVVQQGITARGFNLAFTTAHASNWHPLTWLSHMFDCQLFGINPGMHHLTSLLIHMANSLLLMLAFYKMTNALWKSFLLALLFAVHPMHVESVAWISERKDVLSALFWMLTLISYVRYAKKPECLRYAFVLLFFILGLLSKPMVVTLPFVLLLLDFWPLERFECLQFNLQKNKTFPHRSVKSLILEKIPLLSLAIITSWITISAQEIAIGALKTYPIYLRFGNMIVSYVKYMFKIIFPLNLAVFYPYPEAIPAWKILAGGIFLSSITFVIVKAATNKPYLLMGWFFFLGTLIPVIGLVQVGLQSMADRYSYIPSIGLFIIIVWGLEQLLTQNEYARKIVYLLSGLAITCLMSTTYFQTLHWKNSSTLFKHAAEVTDNNWLACNNWGVTLDDSFFDKKIYLYNKAIKLKPDYSEPYHNRGLLFMSYGKIDAAIANFNKGLELSPKDAKVYNSLGIAMARKGNIEKALQYFQKAIEYKPGYAQAYKNHGTLLARLGNFQKAILFFRKALDFDPNNFSIQEHLYNAMEDSKRQQESLGK